VQNLSAERDELMGRAREADALAVQVQNLSAERDELREHTDELQTRLAKLSVNCEALETEIGNMCRLPEVRFARRLRQLLHSPQASSHPTPEKNEGKGAADE